MVPLAIVAAASAAFPPFLSPVSIGVGHETVHLTDGGVYDNLALEPLIRKAGPILVSDGGTPFTAWRRSPRTWSGKAVRTAHLLDAQVRRLRKRQLFHEIEHGRMIAFWGIDIPLSRYPKAPEAPTRHDLSRVPTRLKKLPPRGIHDLVSWGFNSSGASVSSYLCDGPDDAGV